MQFRIPVATLPGTYADGEIITAEKLNLIVNVLRTGVNANFNDYLKIIAGNNQIYAATTLEALQTIGESLGAADAEVYGIVLNGIEDEESPDIQTLMIYQFDYDAETETGEFVQVFGNTAISFIGILDAIAVQEGNYANISAAANAGATHAAINNGANPHGTTWANIQTKPTTVAGYGITDAATLVGGTVPANQLPSYVDDVIEGVWINDTTFTVGGNPVTPETGKIYVSTSGTNDGKTFRWSGSQFVVVSDTLALGELQTTAYRGDRGKTAYDHSQLATGSNPHSTTLVNMAGVEITGTLSDNQILRYSASDAKWKNITLASNAATVSSVGISVPTGFTNTAAVTSSGTITIGYAEGYILPTTANQANWTNTYNIVNNESGNWNNAYSWGNHANAGYANGTNESNWDNAYSWGNHANAGYVPNTTNIANLPLTGDISAANLTAELPVATNSAKGLMSSTDKTNLDAIQALMGNDANNIVDKITEVLDVFENYPEGTNIVTALNGKLNTNDPQIANWNNAYSWGNHANAGYALNSAIVNASNWDTAYGWGNHANVGYLTTEADTLDSVVNRGSVTNNATVNYITTTRTDYNTASTDGYTAGQVGWDADSGTISVGLLNGASAKVGQQTMYYVQADEALTTGDVVQFNGVAGFKPKVKKAVQSEINNMPSLLMGLVTANIANGALGYVTSFGLLRGVNTANFGTVGQVLYYDSNTSNAAGKTTTTVPTAPNAKIELAAVVREASGGSSNGELLVRVGTSTSLAYDSSVQLSSPATGEVLAYNGTAGRWENKEVVSLGLNVALTNIANNQYLAYNNGTWVNRDLTVYGSVNSVGLNMPTGFTVTNSPITDTGTLGVTYAEGYSLPATATQDNWNNAYGWGNHQAVGYIVGLASGTVSTDNIAAWNGTTGKLLKDTGVLISSVNTAIAHTSLTNNPHAVTKAQVGLTNVTDFAQVRKIASVTSGNIPTWSDTSGANLGTGYTVQTTLSSSTTAIPRADAVVSYINGVVGDIETILDDIIG